MGTCPHTDPSTNIVSRRAEVSGARPFSIPYTGSSASTLESISPNIIAASIKVGAMRRK